MSFQASEYSPSAYADILIGVGFVWKHLNVRGGQNLVSDQLGPIFRKYGVDKKFGIAILHRHFDLTPNERLVEVNNISSPWDVAAAGNFGASIAPTSWLFSGNQLIPYEYEFVDQISSNTHRDDPAKFPEFLAELGTVLKQLRVQRYLALKVHPGPDFQGSVEFTIGKTNISVAPERMPNTHTLEASFFFDPGYEAKQRKAKCEAGKCDFVLQAEDLAKMDALDSL